MPENAPGAWVPSNDENNPWVWEPNATPNTTVDGKPVYMPAPDSAPAEMPQPAPTANPYQPPTFQNPTYAAGVTAPVPAQEPVKEPFYKKTWFAVLFCFLIPPVGIILMWAFKKPQNQAARIALTVFAALLILAAFSGGGNSTKSSSSADTSSTTAQEQTTDNSSESASEEAPVDEVTIKSIKASYDGSTEAGTTIEEGSDDVTVTATYTDGSTETVSDWTVSESVTLKAGKTSKVKISYEGVSTTLKIKCTTLTEKEFKKSCKTEGYKDLLRNPEDYTGENIKFKGEILQVVDDGFLMYTTNKGYGFWDDIVVVAYDGDTRVIEDDIVTVWGVACGNYSYDNALGVEQTVPSMLGKYVTIE